MKPPSRKAVTAAIVALSFLAVGVASASGGKKKTPTGPCGEGSMPNPVLESLRAQLAKGGLRASERVRLQARIAGLQLCVPVVCADGYHRDELTGACVLNTPDDPDPGFDPFDPGQEDDDIEIVPCEPGMMVNPELLIERARLRATEGLRGEALRAAVAELDLERCVPIPLEPPPAVDDDDDVDDYIRDYPQGNSFYQTKQGDIIGWGLSGLHTKAITQNMLGRELFLAAREHLGMDDDAALAWANSRRRNTGLTNAIYNAILCAAANDYAYGTWGYCGDSAITSGRCPESMRNHPGAHGRAIRPLPQHANNLLRLRSGLGLARVVAILTSSKRGNGLGNAVASANPGGKNSFPLLWLPGVDRQVLAESNGKTLEFLSDQANPPDFIMNRGVLDYSGSTLTRYGCVKGGYDGEMDL